MAKVWRNSEGCEFPLWSEAIHCLGANVNGERVVFRTMRALGYELVEKDEPVEEFEVECRTHYGWGIRFNGDERLIVSPFLIPGELYSVRKVKR